MAATIKDISEKTNLSISTISKYINGGVVLPQNKLAIDQAIDELGFRVNEFARGLKTNKSKLIGILIPQWHVAFCAQIVTQLESLLRQYGYGVIVCGCGGDEAVGIQVIEFLISKNVDGIITFPTAFSDKDYIPLTASKNIPVVFVDGMPSDLSYDCIMVDNMSAIKNAVSYLIKKGHTRIGVINGPPDSLSAKERLTGYYNAHSDFGLTVDDVLIFNGGYVTDITYKVVKKALASDIKFTALLATNYEMTIGAIIAINEMGINIPDELSLIGFDDLQLAKIIKPKISIVTQPMERIADMIVDTMLMRLNGNGPDAPKIIRLETGFIEGASVKEI